ncbi:uncharacterized protein VTP21DRAFT_3649 [Calcarisporiella thermophila]|uniref:uncharacterized protein n=1 Tax=Calcarisporiella thermophila TaxID=911321 RepID=UPI0037436B6C
MDDEPLLFEGFSRQDHLIEQLVSIVVIGFVAITAFLTILHGLVSSFIFLVFGMCIVGFAVLLITLLRWYRSGDLEPKFRWYILAHAILLTLLSCVANVYIYYPYSGSSVASDTTALPS